MVFIALRVVSIVSIFPRNLSKKTVPRQRDLRDSALHAATSMLSIKAIYTIYLSKTIARSPFLFPSPKKKTTRALSSRLIAEHYRKLSADSFVEDARDNYN
jgi:hypothetical protein